MCREVHVPLGKHLHFYFKHLDDNIKNNFFVYFAPLELINVSNLWRINVGGVFGAQHPAGYGWANLSRVFSRARRGPLAEHGCGTRYRGPRQGLLLARLSKRRLLLHLSLGNPFHSNGLGTGTEVHWVVPLVAGFDGGRKLASEGTERLT